MEFEKFCKFLFLKLFIKFFVCAFFSPALFSLCLDPDPTLQDIKARYPITPSARFTVHWLSLWSLVQHVNKLYAMAATATAVVAVVVVVKRQAQGRGHSRPPMVIHSFSILLAVRFVYICHYTLPRLLVVALTLLLPLPLLLPPPPLLPAVSVTKPLLNSLGIFSLSSLLQNTLAAPCNIRPSIKKHIAVTIIMLQKN